MDQLKGTVVNVVLIIQEGKGMESFKGDCVFISANFNGRILDSDPVIPSENPQFNTNLVWEVDKKALRKIRSSNQPLRVDCVIVAGSKRDKFGHVLLDLRSAEIIQDDAIQVPAYRWYKVFSTRKKRSLAPELFLSLTIRNHCAIDDDVVDDDDFLPLPPELVQNSSMFPIKYLEDGYIQIGEDSCTDAFSLNIFIKSASNLELLLPEVLVFNHTKNKYCMSVTIFNIPIKIKQFSKELHDTVMFEEKIVVQLLSSLPVLQEFFRETTFEIGFYCGVDILGIAQVSCNGLKNLNEKLVLDNCFFKYPSTNGMVPMGANGNKPLISLEVYLTKHKKKEMACGDHLIKEVNANQIEEMNKWKDEQKQSFEKWKQSEIQSFEKWKSEEKRKFEAELACWEVEERQKYEKELELIADKAKEETAAKKSELDVNIAKCKELQTELQFKLEELKTEKSLKKNRHSLANLIEENQVKFADCDKELLIDYLSKLQSDNEALKQSLAQQKLEYDTVQRTALSKEQTATLLQQLKGLEEKFESAQQAKAYFKQQWKQACEEIHELKSEDYKQLQDQIRERKEELCQFGELFEAKSLTTITSYCDGQGFIGQ